MRTVRSTPADAAAFRISSAPSPARNVIAGRVARLVPHGADVEVVAKTGSVEWIVSVVEPAVAALDLGEGAEVHLIDKARSCHVLGGS